MEWKKREIAALSIQTTGLLMVVFAMYMEVTLRADIWWAVMTTGAWVWALGVKLLKF